jgi:predicted small metal-binding protein
MVSAYCTTVTGACDHCQWEAITGSYPEMVEMYHDHLREDHPSTWMRT